MTKVSSKTVMVEFLTGGVEAVEKLESVTQNVALTAVENLREKGHENWPKLNTWCREKYGVCLQNGRRKRNIVGTTKQYRTQTIKDKPDFPFGKIPLKSIGLKGGDTFEVFFADDAHIVIHNPARKKEDPS